MNLFKTLSMVGLVGVGVIGNVWSLGVNLESDCANAESIFLATYNPKEKPSLTVTEYLKGKGSSESGLGLLQAQAGIKLNEPCEIIVVASYQKFDSPPGSGVYIPPMGNQIGFYKVKNGMVSFDGLEITIQELKKRIKSLNSNTPSPSKTP
jgi:hypothetical protein